MKYFFKKNNGFTLIEVLLYLGIAVTLVGVTVALSSSLLSSRAKHRVINEVEQQGAHLMYVITQSIRNAEGVISPTLASTSGVLSLSVLPVSESPVVFYVDDGTARINKGNQGPISLTNPNVVVSDVVFKNFAHTGTPDVIRIQFTVSFKGDSSWSEFSFSKPFISTASTRVY